MGTAGLIMRARARTVVCIPDVVGGGVLARPDRRRSKGDRMSRPLEAFAVMGALVVADSSIEAAILQRLQIQGDLMDRPAPRLLLRA